MKYLFIYGWSFSRDIWKDFFKLKNSIFLDLPFHNGKDYKTDKDILNSFSLDLYEYINNQNRLFLMYDMFVSDISSELLILLQQNLKCFSVPYFLCD